MQLHRVSEKVVYRMPAADKLSVGDSLPAADMLCKTFRKNVPFLYLWQLRQMSSNFSNS